jgi:sugar phosphate isomerase/epimerase
MKSAVTICLVAEARGGPFVYHAGLADGCARAAALGFDAVEIFAPSADVVDEEELHALLRQYRLKVAAFGTGAGWIREQLSLTSPKAVVRRKAIRFIESIIDLGARFRAPAIIGSMQGRTEPGVTRDRSLGWLAEGLCVLSERASSNRLRLLYEPLNRYETNLFVRIGDAARWLREQSLSQVRILADLFHMNIEEVDLSAAIREAGRMIGHVHFADSNRRAIGMGHTPIKPIVLALHEIGYKGYLSAEIFPHPTGDAAAEQTMKSFRRVVSD